MDILIPNSWLKDFLKTSVKPDVIAKYLSLCGPSVERIKYENNEPVYSIEVTTNRVDTAEILGIAREAAAILPNFGIKTKFLSPAQIDKKLLKKEVSYLKVRVDKNLCTRFTAVLIKNVKVEESPKWMQERLKLVGVRPINNVVDISNYIMHELGQPIHTFDYDKIKGAKMLLRESHKGEKITTLDGNSYILPGGDIVITDGAKRLIDLAGIMGGENSAISSTTQNVLLFVQTYNPISIRKTSMSLGVRTEAATLFEKGLDPELVSVAVKASLDLFSKLKIGKPVKDILDLYPSPYKQKSVFVSLAFINERLGIELDESGVIKILTSLGFDVEKQKDSTLKVAIPSYRASDVDIPEDVVEEVARIYGYHNLPSRLMEGIIPDALPDAPFEFESKIKNILISLGGNEVYTSSLVSKKMVNYKTALKLKNPLGKDGEYLRMSLAPSLIDAAKTNSHIETPFHLFEMANVYLPKKGSLPDEKMYLAGIFSNWNYREAKGIIETLLEKLGVDFEFNPEDEQFFQPAKRLKIVSSKKNLGGFGILEEKNYIYYEFEVGVLKNASQGTKTYIPIAKYPSQIEDLTLKIPEKTKIGEVVNAISSIKLVAKTELKDIYKDAYTFRIWYQDPNKTLEDKEVTEVREKVLAVVKKNFGAILKI